MLNPHTAARPFIAALFALLCVGTSVAEPAEQASPWIIAHRGASADAPENTLAAFREAWKQGADGIEADFRLTADGSVVCIHDTTTKRCGDKNLKVIASTLKELRTVDVGSWKHERYKGERIPTLAEVLKTVPPGKRIFIELKDGKAIIPPTVAAIRASGLKPGQVTVIAFNPDVIARFRKAMPKITANWLISCKIKDGKPSPSAAELAEALKQMDASGVGLQANRAAVTADYLKTITKAGLGIHCWTVNHPKDAQHFARLGIHSITTDKPKTIREAIED